MHNDVPLTVCSVCGGDIYADEVFYRRQGSIFCPDCARDTGTTAAWDAIRWEGGREWPEPCNPI